MEGIFYPQLSPEMIWPVRLLARDLCLIVQPCLRLCSTAADLFPGSGFPVYAPGDYSLRLNRILPPQEASIASAAESLRYQYLVPAPRLSDWRFRLRPCHHWQEQVRFRKVSLPSGLRSGMSRMLDGTLHRDAEAAGSETDMVPALCASPAMTEYYHPQPSFIPMLKAGHARIHL